MEQMPPSDWPVGKSMGHFLVMTGVGGATPGQIIISCIRKQAKQVPGNKSVSSIPPWTPGSCPSFSDDGSEPKKHFPPQNVLGQCFVTTEESKLKLCQSHES